MNDITKIKVDGGPESSYQLYPRNEEFAKRAGGAIDKYNGMTPVECVFPPFYDGDSESSRIFYVKQGVINPVDYKTVTDDIKTAWINLTFLTDATVGKLSSYQRNIKGIAPLIEIGVFGEDFFNTVTYNSPCVFFDDPITQRKKITIYTYNASKKSFSVIVDGPNGFYATAVYSILNDEFSGGIVYDQHLRPYSNNANDTNPKLGQLEMAAAPTKDMQIATKKYVDDSVSNPLNITSATVGQITKITAVDGSGKPTAWEAVDMPSGGGDTLLYHYDTSEDAIITSTALMPNLDISTTAMLLFKWHINGYGTAEFGGRLMINNQPITKYFPYIHRKAGDTMDIFCVVAVSDASLTLIKFIVDSRYFTNSADFVYANGGNNGNNNIINIPNSGTIESFGIQGATVAGANVSDKGEHLDYTTSGFSVDVYKVV